MEINDVMLQFDEIENKVSRLLDQCQKLESRNAELAEKVESLEEELRKKAEAENQYSEQKALIRKRIDGLLEKLNELGTQASENERSET